jgi:hypothetical protein
MAAKVQTSLVEGVVEARNATGIKCGGAWLNVSQYGPRVALPETGAHVRLRVDARGYIKECEVLNGMDKPISAVLNEKDERITRLAVLKAAAEFVGLWGQTREEVKSDHVLKLADRWLEWVQQTSET